MNFHKGNLKVFFSEDRCDENLIRILRNPISQIIMDNKKGIINVIKWTDSNVVLKIGDPDLKANMYYKIIFTRRLMDKIRSLYSPSIGKRLLEGGQELSGKGFLTAPVLAYGDYRRFGIVQYSFLATLELENTLLLLEYISRNFSYPLTNIKLQAKRHFIKLFALKIKEMHGNNIYHSDLRANNILVRDEGGKIDLFFIDHDKPNYNLENRKRMVKNLFQLNKISCPEITRTDRMRFFEAYTGGLKAPNKDMDKKLAGKIIDLTQKWINKKKR